MILTGPMIHTLVTETKRGKAEGRFDPTRLHFRTAVDLDPYDPTRIGPNSYDVRLAPRVATYDKVRPLHDWYDERGWPTPYPHSGVTVRRVAAQGVTFWPRLQSLLMTEAEPMTAVDVPPGGVTLYPGVPYLMQTEEWIEAYGLRPDIDGRSSCGRLFLSVHQTAGRGDDGFRGRLTCEVTVTWPLLFVPGVPLAQVSFTTLTGEQRPYKTDAKYQAQDDIRGSMLYRDFAALVARKAEA